MKLHDCHCDTSADVQRSEQRTGRLEPEIWEGVEPIYLNAAMFDPPRLDVLALDAGPDRVVVLDAEKAHFVDLPEIDPAGWLS